MIRAHCGDAAAGSPWRRRKAGAVTGPPELMPPGSFRGATQSADQERGGVTGTKRVLLPLLFGLFAAASRIMASIRSKKISANMIPCSLVTVTCHFCDSAQCTGPRA